MKKLSLILIICLLAGLIVLPIYAQDGSGNSKFTARALEAKPNMSLGLVVSQDGSMVIVGGGEEGSKNNNITFYDFETGEILHQVESTAIYVADVVLTPDGTQLIGALEPTTVGIWDVETKELVRQIPGISTTALDIRPDGKMVMSNQRDANPILWDFETGEVLHTFEEITVSYGPVAFSSDNKTLAVTVTPPAGSGSLAEVVLWDTESNSEIYRIAMTGYTVVPDVQFSPDGQLLAVATSNSGLRLYDVESGEMVDEFTAYEIDGKDSSSVPCVVFNADGTQVLTAWDPSSVVLWDLASGEPTLVGTQPNRVWRVAFGPDGSLISSSYDGTVNVWTANE